MTGMASTRRSGRRQRGLSLLFALMALVVIGLASVALVRSVDTSSLVIGNLGFKQDATAASGQMTERALTWLQANAGLALQQDIANAGYYASSMDAVDVTGANRANAARAQVLWSGGNCQPGSTCVQTSAEQVLGGNRARYIIMRLCATPGSPAAVNCAVPPGSAATPGGNRGAVDYNDQKIQLVVNNSVYYRVVVRVQGPRGTVAFTETIVQQ